MKNNFFVAGYWKKNLGDDLFIYILCKRYPNKNFLISTEKEYVESLNNIGNLRILKNNYFYKVLNKILKKFLGITVQDLFAKFFTKDYIEIGGSIFIESSNWKERLKKRQFNLDNTDNYYIIGSNFGPYTDNEFKNYYKSFFQQCKAVFRESKSKKMVGLNSIEVAPDVVFGLKNYIDFSTLSEKVHKEYIVFSVIDLSSEKAFRKEHIQKISQSYEEKIYDYAKYSLQKGYEVILMSFCDYEGDKVAIERIYKNFDSVESESVFCYSHFDIEESLSILKNANKIIASRFHASILGWVMKVPTLSLSYSLKINNISNEFIGNEENVLSIREFVQLSNIDLEKKFLILEETKIDKLSKESEKQFLFLDGDEKNE